MTKTRTALGRGLSALVSTKPVAIDGSAALKIAPSEIPSNSEQVYKISLDLITPNPNQPRTHFAQEDINELADSIRIQGVIQPVLLRKTALDKYEIVAGERRYRAAKQAGLKEIPAIVKELTDKETLELAIIENVQRADLNPVEEAKAYERLQTEFNLTQAEVAERVGKERATVANLLRLLKLNPEVLSLLEDGKLSTGHAKVLLSVKDPSAQLNLAKKVISDSLSVREIEGLVARVEVLDGGKSRPGTLEGFPSAKEPKSHFPEIEDRLRGVLGTKVSIKHGEKGSGKILIEYYSEPELDRLVERFSRV